MGDVDFARPWPDLDAQQTDLAVGVKHHAVACPEGPRLRVGQGIVADRRAAQRIGDQIGLSPRLGRQDRAVLLEPAGRALLRPAGVAVEAGRQVRPLPVQPAPRNGMLLGARIDREVGLHPLTEVGGETCLHEIGAGAVGDLEQFPALVPFRHEPVGRDVAGKGLEAAVLGVVTHLEHEAAMGARAHRLEIEAAHRHRPVAAEIEDRYGERGRHRRTVGFGLSRDAGGDLDLGVATEIRRRQRQDREVADAVADQDGLGCRRTMREGFDLAAADEDFPRARSRQVPQADDGRQAHKPVLADRSGELVAIAVRLGEDDGPVAALEGEQEAGRGRRPAACRREVRSVGDIARGKLAALLRPSGRCRRAHPLGHQVDRAEVNVVARQPMPPAEVGAAPQRWLEVAADRVGRGVLERQRLVVDHARHPAGRPGLLQALHCHAARWKVVTPGRHAVHRLGRRRVEMVDHAGPGNGMQGAVDAVLFDQQAAQPRATRRCHEAAQCRMVDAHQHLHGPVDQNSPHQTVDRLGRVVGKHLLGAERDRQIVGVEHFLRAAVEETPVAQQQRFQAMSAVGHRIGGVDDGAAQQGAHRRRVIEVLGADGEIVTAAKERGAPAPVEAALEVVDGVATLRMDEGTGRQFGLQPGLPVGLHVILDRRRQQIAEQVPDQQLVRDLPALPVAWRSRHRLAQQRLVVLVARLALDIGPAADAVAAYPLQLADALDLPGLAAFQTILDRTARVLDDFGRCRLHRRRARAVAGSQQGAARHPWRQGDHDRTAETSTGEKQRGAAKLSPWPPVGIAHS